MCIFYLYFNFRKFYMIWRDFAIPAFCVGVIAVYFVPAQVAVWSVVLLVAVVLALLAWWWYRQEMGRVSVLLGVVLAVGLGLAYGWWRTDLALKRQWTAPAQSQTWTMVVTGLPEMDDETGRTRFIGDAVASDGQRYRLLFQDYNKREWRVGERWQVQARVRSAIATRNEVGFDREAWALANGIDGIASLGKERRLLAMKNWRGFNGAREWVVGSWDTVAKQYPQGSALMKALAVGDGSGLSREAWASFRPLGLNHLISISGLHITMVALLAVWLANQLMRVFRVARPRVYALAVGWLMAVVYTGLAGWQIPALRSLLMLTVFAWTWVRRGELAGWGVWWLALWAVLVYQPMAVLAVGFWLSFGLVGGLLWALAFRLSDSEQQSFWQRRWTVLKQAVMGQWSATLLGGVATIYLFGVLAVFSPLVNAVAIPFFSWILTPLALLASALPFDAPKWLAGWLGEYTIDFLIYLGKLLPESSFAHAPVPLFWLAVGASLLLLLPNGLRVKPLAVVVLGAFALYRPQPLDSYLKITVWDVGQGLSVLMQTPTQNILYDTGTPAVEMALLPNLRAMGVRQIDTLILSHHDDDHDGGFAELKKNLPIKSIWAGQPEFYQGANHCTGGAHWTVNGVLFQFLTPSPDAVDKEKDNELSCVLRVTANGQSVLITGDLGNRGEAQLVKQYGSQLASQVFVLGHHGSKSSNSEAFLRAVSPSVAVASSGFANSFKHPHPDVQNRLQAQGVKLWRTDWQGGVVFTVDKQGMKQIPVVKTKWWWQRKPFE